MYILTIILHEWKKNRRRQSFYKNFAVNILLTLFSICVAAILLFIGYSLGEVLEKMDPEMNPMQIINQSMLYYILIGLTIRFFMQELNTIDISPYLHLPIKRAALINLILLKPILNPFNYFSLFVIIPFASASITKYYDTDIATRFVLCCILIIWFNSFTTTLIKRKLKSDILTLLLLVTSIITLLVLDHFKYFSTVLISEKIFKFIILKPFGLLLPIIVVTCIFMMNKWFYSRNYDLKLNKGRLLRLNSAFFGLRLLNQFGTIGQIIAVYIKLIFRHKRFRNLIFTSTLLLLYGIIFYSNDLFYKNDTLLFLVAILFTGMFMFMFSQWIVRWDAGHFDNLMTQNIPIRTYINANYFLLIIFNLACFVLTLPYCILGVRILVLHLAALIFNTGVNTYLLLLITTFNSKPIDLSNEKAFNYHGLTYKNVLVIFATLLLPTTLLFIIKSFTSSEVAITMVTILGFIGIMSRKPLITYCVNQFNKRKYVMASGFRESE